MFAGRLGCCQKSIAHAEVAAELNRRRFGIEKAVGPAFNRESVAVLSPDGTPNAIHRFENDHVSVGPQLLQTIRETQPADAGADDDDTGHARFTGDALPSLRSGR